MIRRVSENGARAWTRLRRSTSLSMVDSAPFDRFTSSSSWSSTAGIGALGRKSSAGRRDAEEARRARPSAAEAHDPQSRVAQEDSEL